MRITIPIERRRSELVHTPDIELFEQLEKLCSAHAGLGLAAIQVGVPVRQAVIEYSMHADYVSKNGYVWLMNGQYMPVGSKFEMMVEGCLSIPGRRYLVQRWSDYIVRGTFYNFRTNVAVEKKIRLGKPTTFQHEIDHFFDVLISDKGVYCE